MKVGIIGGSGKMGQWFAEFIKNEGYDVIITGRDPIKLEEAGRLLGVQTATNEEAINQTDIIVLSVPINSFEDVLRIIATYIRPAQRIVDITSVKEKPVALMHLYLKENIVLGTHPLFGRGARSPAGMNFVLTPTNIKENDFAQKIKTFLEARKAHVTLMSPDEHDEMMTIILGLSHFISLVTADTLAGVKDVKKLETIGGITYKVLLTLVESVISEDPELYAAIQMSLAGLPEIEDRFRLNATIWADMVKNKDSGRFVSKMQALKELFAANADFGRSYENMYKLAQFPNMKS